MAGCASSCASRSQASPMLTLRRFLKNGEVPSFQEDTLPGVRISCRPHGYDLLRCPCRCLSLLIHYVAFATVTMWAGLPEPLDWRCLICSNNIVLCVSGLENLFPGGAPLFVAHFTLALRRVLEDQGRITIYHAADLSTVLPASSDLLTRPPPRWCLPAPLAPQL